MQEKREISSMRDWYAKSKGNPEIPEWELARFARYEGAKQERSIWYHGTRENNLSDILANGLIVNPKERAWEDNKDATFNSPSQASIGGIYVTRNLLTARIAAQRNKPRDEDRVLVIMELQPRSLVADEDSIIGSVKSVLNNSFYGVQEWQIAEVYMAKMLGTNEEYVNGIKEKYVETGVNLIDQQYGLNNAKLKLRVAEILNNNWEVVLNRQVSHVSDYDMDKSFYRNISPSMNETMTCKFKELEESKLSKDAKNQQYHDFVESLKPKKPSMADFESQHLQFMDQLTRTLKDVARPMRNMMEGEEDSTKTARSTENIGFSGSNRIIAIVKIDHDWNVTLVYGELPDDFKEQWAKTTGKLRMTSKTAMLDKNRMFKTASRAIWYHGSHMGNYESIRTEGLLANPPKRLWTKEDKGDAFAPSKASLPGVYLTTELFDAISAPDNALDGASLGFASLEDQEYDQSILLSIVQADTQSIFVDEDSLSFEVSSAMKGVSDYLPCAVYISGVTGEDQAYFDRIRDQFIVRQLKKLGYKFDFTNPELHSRLVEVLKDGFINSLTRQVAHANEDEWKKAYLDMESRHKRINPKSEITRIQQPSPARGEEMFRQFMDQLTRTLKFCKHFQKQESGGEWLESGRFPHNISFRGSTKIVALLEITLRTDEKDYLDPYQYIFKVLYGQPPQQFLDDWNKMKDYSRKYSTKEKDKELDDDLSKSEEEILKDINYIQQQKKKKTTEEETYENWYDNLSQM